jgi:serine protease Do
MQAWPANPATAAARAAKRNDHAIPGLQVAPSVVKISCLRRHGWGLAESSGSGFIFEEGGSILTNAHVVEGAEELTVLLKDGSELEGQVEHIDELGDVAVVKIKPSKKLPTAVFGQSGSLRVGEFIIAVGAPAALQDTCTLGIVSALQRPSSELGMSARRMSYIQTDAAINQVRHCPHRGRLPESERARE